MSARKYVYKKKRWLWLARIIDGVGEILIKPFLQQPVKSIQGESVEKILVIKLDHLGDLVLTIPSLKLLRRSFPNAQISLVVGPWGRELLANCPYIDNLIVYSAGWLEREKKHIYWAKTISLIRLLRKERYDVCFELRGDLPSIVIAYAAKIPYRVGFGVAGGGWLLTHETPLDESKHQAQIMLDLVTQLIPASDPVSDAPEIFLQPWQRNWARQCLKGLGIEKKLPLIGIHLGAGAPSRRWDLNKYIQLIGLLGKELGANVLLLGDKKEEEYLTAIQGDLSDGVFQLAGKTNISQATALLECCQLFVGNNSGLAHIAAAVDTPVVIIFSAASPSKRWAPYGDKVTVISKEAEINCAHCHSFTCEEMSCMDSISVEEVFAAAQRQLMPDCVQKEAVCD